MILASTSPRRRDLLQAAGIPFEVVPADFDEAALRHLSPLKQARAGAQGKAREVAGRFPRRWVLAADTVVACDGDAMGKPRDGVEASPMLRRHANREHAVISAVCLVAPDGREAVGHGLSRVAFRELLADEVNAYVATGEPLDKAGAYAIQGGAGEFAALVGGRFDTVVGLPLHVVRRLGRALGLW
ncbi:MAG: Maf family protein [Candidatus Dormibacteria bacterium]